MFLNPLGLLALLGVPAIVALHLFRRRFQPRVVSALFLWESRTTTSLSGRRRDRILNSPSFWTELLLALLLGFAIAGPRACSGLEARHLVVVLDTSASMSARPMAAAGSDSPSFAQQAAARVRAEIGALPSGSRVTLVRSGARPSILSGPAAFPEEALNKLETYVEVATAGRHDLEPATSLALQLAGDGAVTLITDRFEPKRYPEQVGVVALGQPVENLAITRASRLSGGTSGAGSERVLVTVANFAARSKVAEVTLDTDGVELASKGFELEAGARKHFSFDLPAGTPPLRATLGGDGFELDDQVFLMPPPLRAIALGSTLEVLPERHLGLTSGAPGSGRLDRWRALVEESSLAKTAEDAHVLISTEPAGGSRTWCLVLHPAVGESLDLVGPFLVEKRHPLMNGVNLDGVVWSARSELDLPGAPLVSAGNLPLITEELDGARILFHMNFDPERSSLQRSPDWPILLDNLAEERRRQLTGPQRTNLAMGESFTYLDVGAAEYSLETPGETLELRARGALVVEDLNEVGRYSLVRDGATLAEFAVHFGDDAESDLRGLDEGARASSVELAEQRAGSSWVELLLATLALVALSFDWFVLRPRRAQAEAIR